MVSANNQSLRILQLSDCHLTASSSDDNNRHHLEAVIRHIAREERQADCLLATGDLSDDGSNQSYLHLKAALQPIPMPVYALAGNHDNPTQLAQQFGHADHILLGEWLIIFINSAVANIEAGEISTTGILRLQALLSQHRHRHTLLAMHHHPINVGSQWIDEMGLRNADKLFQLLKPHTQVRAIISGHVHQAFSGQYNDIRVFTTPSTCRQFLPHSVDFALDTLTAGYRWLNCHANGKIESGITRLANSLTS